MDLYTHNRIQIADGFFLKKDSFALDINVKNLAIRSIGLPFTAG